MPKIGEKSVSVTVAVRVRPINFYQHGGGAASGGPGANDTTMSVRGNGTIVITDPTNPSKQHTFNFDHAYNSMTPESTLRGGGDQESIFKQVGLPVLEHSLQGYNTCLFAYGQTGSGKTYTISGFDDPDVPVIAESERKGLIPRVCEALMERISAEQTETRVYRIEMSYYEIYNEKVRCLLDPDPNVTYRVREHPVSGPFVADLTTIAVDSVEDMVRSIRKAARHRQTASTQMNATSSRSHAVCCVSITSTAFDAETGEVCETTSKMNIVDLAGSERSAAAGTSGLRLQEGSNINKSLLTLGNVIEALASSAAAESMDASVTSNTVSSGNSTLAHKFIPYRESTLTWLLKEALGGNSRTAMIAAVSPNPRNYDESLNTLKYADRAKHIRNLAAINVDSRKQLIFDLKAEITVLREQLEKLAAATARSRLGLNTDAVSLSKDCPVLVQLYPLPMLRDPFIFYLCSNTTIITRDTIPKLTDDDGTVSPTRARGGEVRLRGGLGIVDEHVEIEVDPMTRGLFISSLRSAVRVNDKEVLPHEVPEPLHSGCEIEVGSYVFRVLNAGEATLDSHNLDDALAVSRMERSARFFRDNDTNVLFTKIKEVVPNINVIGETKKVTLRNGLAPEKVVGRDGHALSVFEWCGTGCNGRWDDVVPDEDIATEAAALLQDLLNTTGVVKMILVGSGDGDDCSGSIIAELPWEHELPKEGPSSSSSSSCVLVRSPQLEGCLLAMRWSDEAGVWCRGSASEAELCALRLMEKRRLAQHAAAMKAVQDRVTDLASVQAQALEASEKYEADLRAVNDTVRHTQAMLHQVNQETAQLDAKATEAHVQHRDAIDRVVRESAAEVADLDAELSTLQQTTKQLTDALEAKTDEADHKLKRLKVAEETRDSNVHTMQTYRTHVATFEREIERAEAEAAKLRSEITALRTETEAKELDTTVVQGQLSAEDHIPDSELERLVEGLRHETDEMTEQQNQTFRNLDSLQKQCEVLFGRMKNAEEALTSLQAERDLLQEAVAGDEGEINSTLAEQRTELLAKKSRLSSGLADARKASAELSTELAKLVEKARQDERHILLSKMDATEQQSYKALESKRAEHQTAVKALQRERAKEKEAVQAVITKRDALKRRLKELEADLSGRDRQIKTLVDENAGWQAKLRVVNTNASKGKDASDKLQTLDARLRSLSSKTAELEKATRDRKKDEDELRPEAKALKEQQTKLKAEIEDVRTRLRAAEKEAKQLHSEAIDTKRDAQLTALRAEDCCPTTTSSNNSNSHHTNNNNNNNNNNATTTTSTRVQLLGIGGSGGSGTPRGPLTPSYMRSTASSQGKHGAVAEEDQPGFDASGGPRMERRGSLTKLTSHHTQMVRHGSFSATSSDAGGGGGGAPRGATPRGVGRTMSNNNNNS
eukprot:PhM_4_TR8457/c4_g1_i1/m.1210/K17914/KIF13; kinesin family member 13